MIKQVALILALGVRLILVVGLLAGPWLHEAWAGEIASSVDAAALPKKKQTPLGLYLTPKDAHAALEKDPGILFIDVRDPVEVSYVGHPKTMDANIPWKFATYRFNPNRGAYHMTENRAFVAQVEAAIAKAGGDKSSPVFLLCRSGARSADATKKLAAAGYTNVWNLVEGFEGDKDQTTKERTVNGWRNAGLPWAYKLPAEKAFSEAKK